ncbi:hypothetical protein IQ07DRAFT_683889 [Pyrenochaeta sp. DS3sAY3a]|nr:hypothetical protein IQ07DRAFT_683889 [Pyrenochaeta sp. DS3sAY3a]
MSEKTVLPCEDCESDSSKDYENKKTMPASPAEHRRYPRLYHLAVLVTVAAIIIWFDWYHRAARLQRSVLVPVSTSELQQLAQPKLQYDKCTSVVTSKARHFEYNITTGGSAPIQWHFQESSPPLAWWNFRGKVAVLRGDKSQSSDIEVRLVIKSDDESEIDNIILNSSEAALNLYYAYTEPRQTCTEVHVMILLRPWPRRSLDILDVRTQLLDVTINEHLNWEVGNLIAHSSQGTLLYQNSVADEPLVTHNVSVSSWRGDVLGLFPANGNLDVKNDYGHVDFRLVHYNEYFELESIKVSTMNGHIHIDTALESWPRRPLNHTSMITSDYGNINGLLPHGSTTFLSTESSIEVKVKTFGTFNPYDPNDFRTVTREGTNHVHLLEPDPESIDGYYSPFLNMTSHHVANLAKLVVRYPDSWYGTIDAGIFLGPLDFRSKKLHKVERGNGYIKATRGKHGESTFNAWVDDGEMDIQIGDI